SGAATAAFRLIFRYTDFLSSGLSGRWPVSGSGAVVEAFVHAQVTFVTALRDFSFFHRFDDRAARFVNVPAVVEPAAVETVAHFHEIVGQFFGGDVDDPEFPDTRSVDNVAAMVLCRQ